jgi:D-alanyl-D-alanine carboxypeptidase
MKRSFELAAAILLLGGCGDSPASPDQTLAERLQASLEEVLDEFDGIGASAAIWIPGEGLWTGAAGISHGSAAVTADMLFGIASTTKPFTAALILQLAEEGLLTLDDTLDDWLPQFTNIAGSITIRQLLGHTSGIFNITEHPGITDSTGADLSRIWTLEEAVSTFTLEPHCAPGEGWYYSNTNYLLLGMIIEEATGSQLETEYRNRFFGPLGLNRTFLSVRESLEDPIAHPWEDLYGTGTLEDISAIPWEAYLSLRLTSGGIFSTPADVVTWSRALFEGTVLQASSLAEMLDFGSTTPGEGGPGLRYGLGVDELADFFDGHRAIGHDGNINGYRSLMKFLPDSGIHIAVLMNQQYADCLYAAGEALLRLVLADITTR